MTSNFTAFLRPFRAACLFVLLTVCCGGCSDSGSVDETPPADQLALSPSSLVFDEQDPAKNEFTVTVTDGLTWVLQVKPSAAGCKFSASSGRGSGSFRVEQMPDDSSIEIEAVHTYNNGTQLKSNSVRITRGKAVLEPTLELAPEKLTFDPDDASANTVQVRSNTVWSAVASDEGLVFSPASGENDGVITVTAAPSLDAAYQSKIYRKDGPSGSDPYQYWTSNTMAYLQRSGYWGKGHLCMSSERGGANQQINMQTFYPTNIAPQPSAKASTFGTVWGYVEALFAGTRNSENDIVADDGVQNMNIVSDTLFVVAGCYYEHDYWQEYDSSDSNQAEPDPAQKLCTMPTHQFKMALRTKSGSTGKRIQECTADELQAVGFWIETFTESPETSARAELRRLAVPVSFIEEKMGMTFFPDVPEEVKTRIPVPEEWGF